MWDKGLIQQVASQYMIQKYAGPLRDVSKLRYQAVFMMGAGGSGKGYVGKKWMKYLPGGGSSGASDKQYKSLMKQNLTEAERGLSNINFEAAKDAIESYGFSVELTKDGAKIPFRLYDLKGDVIPPSMWEDELPPQILSEVKGLREVIFKAPIHSLPSYWRQVNPDLYKEELKGYSQKQPGYTHEMSSEMSKIYLQAILKTGDPLFVDGTGSKIGGLFSKIKAAREAGYRISLVLVIVPLVVNLIRNSSRARNVPPSYIVPVWFRVKNNFPKLRSEVDRSKVVINRNDSADIKKYYQNKEKIDSDIAKGYPGKYSSLEELIRDQAPSEYREWRKPLGWP